MAVQLDQFKQKARNVGRKALWIILALFLFSCTGYYCWRTFTYSDGSRAGILYKVSKKGYLFKTFEGQLHQGGSVMISDQSIFNFSAENKTIYLQLQQMEGKNVRLYYHELNNAFPWQGDTNYMVYKVEPVE